MPVDNEVEKHVDFVHRKWEFAVAVKVRAALSLSLSLSLSLWCVCARVCVLQYFYSTVKLTNQKKMYLENV